MLDTEIYSPIERVFDLARSIDLHQESMSDSTERAVGGVTLGLIDLGEMVTWEATHFGIKQKLTSEITMFDRPRHFRDSMVSGAFARFDHDHFFKETKACTLMRDVFDYDSPFGILGTIADKVFLERYMRNLLTQRNKVLKEIAEGQDWQKYLS